jgi:hypothetical protein
VSIPELVLESIINVPLRNPLTGPHPINSFKNLVLSCWVNGGSVELVAEGRDCGAGLEGARDLAATG